MRQERAAVDEDRQRPQRQGAPSAERAQEGSLGQHRAVRGRGRRPRRAARARHGRRARHSTARAPWPTCGSSVRGSSTSATCVGQPQALEGGQRQHARPHVEGPLEPGRHVAAQVAEGEVRTQPRQLGPTAHRARRHRGAGQAGPSRVQPDERVAGIGAFGDTRQHEARRVWPRAGPWRSAPPGRPGRRAPPAAPPSRRHPALRAGRPGRRRVRPRWSARRRARSAVRRAAPQEARPRAAPATAPAATLGWRAAATRRR